MDKKGLTLNGLTIPHALQILISALMVTVGIYLTTHYYDTLFPTTLEGGKSLCDISSFWNCDVATYSPVSSFAGVPIAFFGFLNGIVFLTASLFPSVGKERTAYALARWNAIGCVVLFAYSLIALGTLCPMCSAYYVLSLASAYLFWRYGQGDWLPDFKVAGIWAVVALTAAVAFNRYTDDKKIKQVSLSGQVVAQFLKLANYGDPETESPFKVHMATAAFADAPIRVSVFSDFQCPFCKVVAEQLPTLVRQYGDKVNIQYFFYPLDSSCNTNVKSAMHQYACRAAMLAACDPVRFPELHDEIFAGQEGMNLDTLGAIAAKHGLTACFEGQSTRDAVLSAINQASKYNLRSTPTLIINGRKIEGSIPTPQFHAIFEELLKAK